MKPSLTPLFKAPNPVRLGACLMIHSKLSPLIKTPILASYQKLTG